jgi:hypothetical protein
LVTRRRTLGFYGLHGIDAELPVGEPFWCPAPLKCASQPGVHRLRPGPNQRGWASGSAALAHETALRESVDMYYDLYESNPGNFYTPVEVPRPSRGEVDSVRDLEHGGERRHARADRRAEVDPPRVPPAVRGVGGAAPDGFPELGVDEFGGAGLPRTVRITYPTSELTNNRESYSAVQSKDTPTTRVVGRELTAAATA